MLEHSYFDSLTKLFSDLYLTKSLDISTKSSVYNFWDAIKA